MRTKRKSGGADRTIGSGHEVALRGETAKKTNQKKKLRTGEVRETEGEVRGSRIKAQGHSPIGVFGLRGDLGTASVRSKLTSGVGFERSFAKAIARVAGEKVTKAGLLAQYDVMGDFQPILTETLTKEKDVVSYTIAYVDNEGSVVARAGRYLRKHEDGSLELHRCGMWVDPQHRGLAAGARIGEAEAEMLRALSSHENSRLTLRAGKANDEKIGPYVWANFGFDFIDGYDVPNDTLKYGARYSDQTKEEGEVADLPLLQNRFEVWLRDQAGDLGLGESQLQAILEASRAWKHPWEIASFDVPGVQVPVEMGDATVPCGLGKAYLTHGDAPAWDGVLFVNRESTGRAIFDAYSERSLAKGDARLKQEEAELLAALGGTTEAKRAAVAKIGREKSVDWLPRLRALKKDPEVAEDVDRAIHALQGARIDGGLERTARDEDVPDAVRRDAVLALTERKGALPGKLIRDLMKDDVTLPNMLLFALARRSDAESRDLFAYGALELLDYTADIEKADGWRAKLVKRLAEIGEDGEKAIVKASKVEEHPRTLAAMAEILAESRVYGAKAAHERVTERLDQRK